MNINGEMMKLPTAGMERFTPRHLQHWHEAKLTTFYRDRGQLHWPHDADVPTSKVYVVQREDGLLRVVPAGVAYNMYPILQPHLDENIKAEVIECQVPMRDEEMRNLVRAYVEEPLLFLADRHPGHEARVALAILLNDTKK